MNGDKTQLGWGLNSSLALAWWIRATPGGDQPSLTTELQNQELETIKNLNKF